MIYVVGIGPGNTKYLTEVGRQIIEESTLLIGGQRNLESFPNFKGQKIILGNSLQDLVNQLETYPETEKITILASGDPLIYGIGKYLRSKLGQELVTIISGVSAVQYLFSQIPLDMNDLYITSSHGKTPNFDKLLAMEKVAMVTDEKIGPSQIGEEIIKRHLKKRLYIGENLSYPNEKIICVKPEEIVGQKFDMNVVVIVDEK